MKLDFSTYITNLWAEIGYTPEEPEEDNESDFEGQIGGEFTPAKVVSSPTCFTGISLKNFPRNIDVAEIIEYLIDSGLPDDKKDSINFNSKGTIMIRNLDNEICRELINSIHGKIFFSRKIYCNGIIPMTPEKDGPDVSLTSGTNDVVSFPENSEVPPAATVQEIGLPQILSPLGSPTWPLYEAEDLARRNSLSLLNRTPPPNSLAADLLGVPNTKAKHLSTLSAVRDLAETLSDFNSCISSDGSEVEEKEAWSVFRMKKRKKSPQKDKILKRIDMRSSPDKESAI